MDGSAPKADKYKAYRERKRAAGLKQVRLWTLDSDAPGFRERVMAEGRRLAALESERSALIFLEALGDDASQSLAE